MDLTVTIGQYPLLFFSQGSIWHQVILVSWLTLKLSLPHNILILAMISSVSSEGNIGVILLWTSWRNIQTIYFGLYLFQSVVTVMQLAITILPSTGLKEMGLSWGEAQASAKDRTLWRSIVVALCPTGDEEDK